MFDTFLANIQNVTCIFSLIFGAVYGALFGSFSSVIVGRIHSKEPGIFLGRSHCPKCDHRLGFLDLFPILSYLGLRGKCRYCGVSIPSTYLLLEIGAAFLGMIFAYHIWISDLALMGVIFSIIIAVIAIITIASYTLYDILYLEIPDEVLLPAIGLISVLLLVSTHALHLPWIYHVPMEFPYHLPLSNGVLGAMVIFSFFMVQIIASNGRWMGGGDLRLALFVGLLIGFPSMLIALFVAYISGSLIGIFLLLFRGKNGNAQVPFGPFLTIGVVFALLFAPVILPYFSVSST